MGFLPTMVKIAVKTDEQAILTLIEEAMSELKDNDEKGLERLFKREAALNSIIFTAEKMADLKNGDEINIRASYDEQLAKDAGIKFRNTQFKYLVEGLTDALAIDVKNNVKLLFEGYVGRGYRNLHIQRHQNIYRRTGIDTCHFIFRQQI